EILKEFLTPHIDAMILPAVVGKIGTRLAAERRKKLGEAHELLKAASTVLGELYGAPADGNEEEGRSDGAHKGADDGPRDNESIRSCWHSSATSSPATSMTTPSCSCRRTKRFCTLTTASFPASNTYLKIPT